MTADAIPSAYPFAAIVGQEPMCLSLLLNAVDPRIGGVLIRGEKGTAKSTIARALAALLPEQRVLAGCAYGCDPDDPDRCADHRAVLPDDAVRTRPMPVVELPVNATEDRVAGALDLRAALGGAGFRFQPGLLAAAHRGVLYVDEVNLLPDHIVDLVLDAAAMGRNTVEREGVSLSHAARFLLIGTMNPEEGELRPQLQDRFGLCVQVAGIADVEARVEVMRRRRAYDADPVAFARAWAAEQDALRRRVLQARALLPAIEPPDEILRLIAGISLDLDVDGHRADLVMLRAACALAALDGRTAVTRDDLRRAAALALAHRMRRRPFEQEPFSDERLEEALRRAEADDGGREAEAEGSDEQPAPGDARGALEGAPQADGGPMRTNGDQQPERDRTPAGDPPRLPPLLAVRARAARGGDGRQQRAAAGAQRGRSVRSVAADGDTGDIAVSATLRATAARTAREGDGAVRAPSPVVRPADLRTHRREAMVGATIIFLIDLSGSMRARQRLAAARGAALALLTEAYQRRDRVALVAFRGQGAEVVLPPTSSAEQVQQFLGELPVGGRTPLAAGLRAGLGLVRQIRAKDPRALCVPVLLSDGKANVAEDGCDPVESALAAARGYQQPGVHPLVLDTEDGAVRLGLAARVAEQAGARYIRLADLTAQSVAAETRAAAIAATG